MAEQSIAEIIKSVQDNVTTIVRGEIELVKAELLPQVKSAGLGAGMFGAAGYLAVTGGALGFLGLGFGTSLIYDALGLSLLVSLLLGFLTLAVILFILAGILVLIGKARFSFTPPNKTIESVENSVGAVRSAVEDSRKEIESKPILPKG